ncbi:AAA family ATPase [Bordetella bronchiseptica]|uniref:AAA family ATPase n=1 Tax=Bordetella bronchiseptica TaxID=518 RepID=UPI0004616FEE|nr:AAA family ATPase [Bordetella bronchiseptica]KDD18602.1 AAA domain protein [Bordetella bronchiseptica MBORD707]
MTVLQLLKYRDRYEKLAAAALDAVDGNTQILLKDFGKFFKEHPDCSEIHSGPFTLWFTLKRKNLGAEQKELYRKRLRQIDKDVDPTVEAGLMQRLVDATTATRLTELLEGYQDGEVDLTEALRGVHEHHQEQLARKVRVPEVLDDISELLAEDQNNTGLRWRMGALACAMRAVQEGDFVVLAARPDAGKTTAIASELTHMAPQVDALYPGEHRSIIWLNNEGPGRRIKRRLYQAALGLKVSEMYELDQRGVLREEYARAVGRSDIIRVFDIHDFWSHEVEDIIANIPSALVVFDMIDNIKFGGEVANGGQRTDQALEAMYQWARNMAVKYGTRAIATSQVSAAGEGMPYPDMSMLKDSKTGKQGAADAIVILGKSNAPELQNTRFIGIPKNKLHIEGGPKDPQREAVFDAERARVRDPS